MVTELLTGLLGLCLVDGFAYLMRSYLLTRAKAVAALREEKDRFATTLASIGDAVIATDAAGRVTFLNDVAQSRTGWTQAEAVHQPLDGVFHIVDAATQSRIENPSARALREGAIINLSEHSVLIGRNDTRRFIDDSAAPIRDLQRESSGVRCVSRYHRAPAH